MQNAKAVPALDYVQQLNVVRLKIFDGAQFLLRTSNSYEIISWIEQLQTSINISLDLDERSMPKFHTLPQWRQWSQLPFYWQPNYAREMAIRTELDYVLDVVFSRAPVRTIVTSRTLTSCLTDQLP
ncbi:hypothetical protein NQZ79_g8343 [Umbelopsis isabellina]|nr:hypothetical protein NQZ79_g8343 [Umbelopsis isabellina]